MYIWVSEEQHLQQFIHKNKIWSSATLPGHKIVKKNLKHSVFNWKLLLLLFFFSLFFCVCCLSSAERKRIKNESRRFVGAHGARVHVRYMCVRDRWIIWPQPLCCVLYVAFINYCCTFIAAVAATAYTHEKKYRFDYFLFLISMLPIFPVLTCHRKMHSQIRTHKRDEKKNNNEFIHKWGRRGR